MCNSDVNPDVDLDLFRKRIPPLVDRAFAGRDVNWTLRLWVVGDAAEAHEEGAMSLSQ